MARVSRAKVTMLIRGGKPLVVNMVAYSSLGIQPKGYGRSDRPKDFPIVLADMPSGLMLYVWADNQQEAPTHAINLEGIKVKRKE